MRRWVSVCTIGVGLSLPLGSVALPDAGRAEPQELATSVDELVRVVQRHAPESRPFSTAEREGVLTLEIPVGPHLIFVGIEATKGPGAARAKPARSVVVGLIGGVSATTSEEQEAAALAEFEDIVGGVWTELTGAHNFADWNARAREESWTSPNWVLVYTDAFDGVRVVRHEGMGLVYVFDPFTECVFDATPAEAEYRKLQSEGLCPSEIGLQRWR